MKFALFQCILRWMYCQTQFGNAKTCYKQILATLFNILKLTTLLCCLPVFLHSQKVFFRSRLIFCEQKSEKENLNKN